MNRTSTNKVGLPPIVARGIDNKDAVSTSSRIARLVAKVLIKFGLLKTDVDYHVNRASMVIIYRSEDALKYWLTVILRLVS